MTHLKIIAGFEVLTAALLKIQVFWDVAVCCCASSSQWFKELWCLCLQYQADFLSSKSQGATCPVTLNHMLEDLNIQCYGSLYILKKKNTVFLDGMPSGMVEIY